MERSLDGVEWKPWQYYAITDEECERSYGIKALPGVPRFEKDDQVICTSWYSRLDPLEDGEVGGVNLKNTSKNFFTSGILYVFIRFILHWSMVGRES